MKKTFRTASAILWVLSTVMVTTGSLLPQINTPAKYHLDKFLHGGAYAGLTFLAILCTTKRNTHIALSILLIVLGGGIELIQEIVPGRSGTLGDFAADVAGVFVGILIGRKLKFWIIQRFM